IRGSATDCEAIIHIAGIVAEVPPDRTFQRVTIDGPRYVVLEAERSCVQKLIYVSSLGAERGTSEYHKSKSVAEEVVRTFTRDWLRLRPRGRYGPGGETLPGVLRAGRTTTV